MMASSGTGSYLIELLTGAAALFTALGIYISKIIGSRNSTKTTESTVHEAEVSGAVEVTKVATELVKALEVRVNSLTERVTHLETVNTQLRSEHSILTHLYEQLQGEYKVLQEENGNLRDRIDLITKARD